MNLAAESRAWRLALAHAAAAFLLPPFSLRRVRAALYRLGGIDLPLGVEVGGGVRFTHHNVTLGRGAYIGPGVWLSPTTAGQIAVGARTAIGPRCHLITATHEVGPSDRRAGTPLSQPIAVGNGVWIGADVTILPGVTIGDGAVVAAGSVVTADIPADSFAAGVPAQVKRDMGAPA